VVSRGRFAIALQHEADSGSALGHTSHFPQKKRPRTGRGRGAASCYLPYGATVVVSAVVSDVPAAVVSVVMLLVVSVENPVVSA
jgi:hypothetical protein